MQSFIYRKVIAGLNSNMVLSHASNLLFYSFPVLAADYTLSELKEEDFEDAQFLNAKCLSFKFMYK